MELSKRQFLLLKILYGSTQPISAGELTRLLGISARTLRYDIGSINSATKEPVISSCKNGYYFEKNESSRKLLKDVSCFDTSKPQKFIAMELLRSKECSIYDLSEKVYASESTIYKLVKNLIPTFNRAGLQILRRGEMLSAVGSETDKRVLLTHYIYNDANDLATALNNFNEYFTLFTLNDIRQIVVSNFNRFQIHIDDLYLKNIIVSVAISVQRVHEGYCASLLPHHESADEYVLQQQVLTGICDDIYEQFHVRIAENDFQNLLFFLSGAIKNSTLQGNE